MIDITAFNTRARDELRRCLKGKTPWNRHRGLTRAAARFRQKKDWRGELPESAGLWAAVLSDLACDEKVGSQRGRPEGSFHYAERPYVDRAYRQLIALAARHDRLDWVAELFKRGGVNKPSRGRLLVATYAIQLAQNDGVRLSPKKVAELIPKRAVFWIDGVI